jgi:hypothetical protein
MINGCGAIGGMKIVRGNRSTQRKPIAMPLCLQNPHDLSTDRTLVAMALAIIIALSLVAFKYYHHYLA